MIGLFIDLNALLIGVNVSPSLPMYQLVDPGLLRTLMRRTGSGAPVTVRGLADMAGCSRGTVGNLLAEQQRSVSAATAHAIARVIGVDVLILFAPTGRAVPAVGAAPTPATAQVEAAA
ncbi:helix-turn-helix domain-containing protein [Streptomyces sp. NPDC057743]|uniref:helix-turn-helix domain-containing protein n=1 Tax=Streptomyces sp. NPDC057743 TaxID=3346236 RepID=UPI0036A70725